MLPVGVVAGSSSMVTLDSSGIPVRALQGYRKAATLINSADPSCHIDWALPVSYTHLTLPTNREV